MDRVRVWDAAVGTSTELQPSHSGPVTAVAVSPNGRVIAARGRDTVVRLWDAATLTMLREFRSNRGMTGALAFTPDSRTLAVAGGEVGVQLWDIENAKRTDVIPDPDYTWSVAFSADGRTLAIGSGNGEVRLYDMETRKVNGVLLGHEGGVRTMAFSPDGRTLATGGDDTHSPPLAYSDWAGTPRTARSPQEGVCPPVLARRSDTSIWKPRWNDSALAGG